MKKSIIALAILASVAGTAQADTTLYGSVRVSVEYNDNGVVDSTDVTNNSSRWGIKGHEDLGNGLSAIYKYEFGVDADKGTTTSKDGEGQRRGPNRLSYVGLQGGFGTVALGAQWSPYYNVAGYNDIFNGSFSYSRTYLGTFRLADVVSYTTPDMGGFKAQVALVADGAVVPGAGPDDHLDAYNIGLSYANNGIFAGATYLSTNGLEDDASLVAVAGGYSNDMFRVGLVAEQSDNYVSKVGSSDLRVGENALNVSLAGSVNISESDKILAAVEMLDRDIVLANGEDADEAMHYAIGYQHNFSKRTRVWAEYSYFDTGVEDSNEDQTISVGLRTDF